jgi:4-aminobutyrate aminotransferase-like enzyme
MTAGNAKLLARRRALLGPNVSTFYQDPVHIVRGSGVWLWDSDGRKYLDCYNNVPHVGHCHPKVVEAIARQAATLNTHTRYLHAGILDYIERLVAKFDGDLKTAIMVCTGSEANDIALRMARAVTGNTGIIATDNTYHGNTALVSQLNTGKTPIGGYTDIVCRVPAPNSALPAGSTPEANAASFAAGVEAGIATLAARGHGLSALIVCPFFANEGFPTLQKGFLDKATRAVRRAGGLVIADEVQPGFGRIGSHWWGHQKIGFQPDIVTLGKPMANGHPVGAVVTSPDTLAAFRNAFGYFNTFGGNPVSCAAAASVLDVIAEEGLIENAFTVGKYARSALRDLAKRHAIIDNVRGSGLFFGVEFVQQADRKPATTFTTRVVEAMRADGILLNSTGLHKNTLKIRTPMPFSKLNADQLVETLDKVLSQTPEAG